MNTVYSKDFYRREIKEQHKSLEQIADKLNISVSTLKRHIKKCYIRKAWAEKLISAAEENGKQQKLAKELVTVKESETVESMDLIEDGSTAIIESHEAGTTSVESHEVATKSEEETGRPILVDTSMLLNYPDALLLMNKKSKVFIPEYCVRSVSAILSYKSKREMQKCMEIYEKLKQLHFQQVRCDGYLPWLEVVPLYTKKCSLLFLKYFVYLKNSIPNLMAKTCSREIRELAALNGIELR